MERPDAQWCPSPNFRASPARDITCVVIHATATTGLESPKEWLCNAASKVSAHYLIGREGEVLQLVQENDVAWHAGESEWRGQPNVNAFSIGIELVNPNDGKTPYPEPQLAACAQLVTAICLQYGIEAADVVGHLDVAPGRKNDPAAFPWDEFRAGLHAAGVA